MKCGHGSFSMQYSADLNIIRPFLEYRKVLKSEESEDDEGRCGSLLIPRSKEPGLAEDRRRVLGFSSPWRVFVTSKPV